MLSKCGELPGSGSGDGADGEHSSSKALATPQQVHLMLPAPPPVPAAGCRVCAALDKQRTEARHRGDYSAVTDCNVEIAAHGKRH